MNYISFSTQVIVLVTAQILLFLLQSTIALNDANDLILTAKEKDALDKFKTQVLETLPEEFMKSDAYLIKWLRVAKLSLTRAESLLLENVKWRQKNNISQILTEDWEDMEHDFPISYDGHDKEGRPITTLGITEWDLRLATLQGRMPRVQRYLSQSLERTMQNVLKAQQEQVLNNQKPPTRALVLIDLEGFNAVQQACIQCLAAMANWAITYDSYYPNLYDEVIMVNTPQVAVIALNGIRPIMSESTRNMLKVFNSNKEDWMKYLDERVERNERSVRLGGTI